MPVRLVISICHLLLLVSCNDRRGVDYATTLTQALLQVLASYSVHYAAFFSNSHVLTPIPMHLIFPFPSHSHPMADLIPLPMGIPWDPWESHGTHGIPVFPISIHTSKQSHGGRTRAQDM